LPRPPGEDHLTERALRPLARRASWYLLGQLDDEAVGVGHVQRAVSPGTVDGTTEYADPVLAQAMSLGIDIFHEEQDLTIGTPVGEVLPDELRQPTPMEQPEPRGARVELGVAVTPQLEPQSEEIAVELDGRLQITDVPDHVVQRAHGVIKAERRGG
jgi:hypothetical protein